ncbi:nitrogenase-stabilizing/protective protein NifW [Pararhodospirillum oryzae]|uniref:Nitrogenase-stabilizing/protective protein NifW n=1 Tax=Pararhodospirillum oryzae TaxID=478448 RepID=A0A512H7G0_9PROT|nr:nitrogenase-stabilizing/protective protein NifW [Pararhodospirillum oryzae]GEO81392.1 nitrogenase-stabilizing/protective protein NifW [Pararhodospirillum oryzae]
MSDLLSRLRHAASAEEFFTLLEVPYDPHVLAVNRLHVLKRYQMHLKAAPAPEDEAALIDWHRTCLAKAHADFEVGDARTYKVFRVFQQTPGRGFVGLDNIASVGADG